MPFMFTCTYCGKERTTLAEWRKGNVWIHVCESKPCRRKALTAGYLRHWKVR